MHEALGSGFDPSTEKEKNKKKKKKEAGHLLCKQSPLNIRKLEREMKTGLAA
jgi:hypothetical protein